MRLAVYSDFPYRRHRGRLTAEQPFSLFLAGLAGHVEQLVLVGRLDPSEADFPYPLPATLSFAELPHYPALTHPAAVARAMVAALGRFWRVLDEVDAVWLMGPHPLALAFAVLAVVRRRRVVLGVRQDLPEYTRHRHPGRRSLMLVATALQAAFRAAGRRCAVVVVGDELAHQFSGARRLLTIWVSLVSERDIAGPETAGARDYAGPPRVLSVGRLDPEKNPLMLADVLAAVHARGHPCHLVVCGSGSMEHALARRLEDLGLGTWGSLRGHVPVGPALFDLYRSSHALLHVSWTEGMPQVLLEAFAARLPVVATAVGGVAHMAAGEAALLVAPGDPEAAAEALERVLTDEGLRAGLIDAGLERVRAHTLESECARVAAFLGGVDQPAASASSS